MYEFTDDCRIGIPEIDSEHKQLFELINAAHDILSLDDVDLQQKSELILYQLKDYAKIHFAHEEAYMQAIQDPELTSQKQEHSDFITYINTTNIARLDNANIRPAFENLLKYLSNWLFHHIIGSDILIGKFESKFAFTSKYYTGIDLIDNEHQTLFEIIQDADAVIHADFLHDKYDEIMRIILKLKNYTQEHFRDEETYMSEIGYPDLEKQQKAHASFIEKINDINLDDLDENQQDYLEDMIAFLLNWLSVHILHMDEQIGAFAKNRLL